jgi:hypothetical protein
VKGFRKTGNGPKSGFTFSSKAGFGPSSGKVKNISGYSRRAPKRRAVGGLVKDNIVEAPGFSDFAKGGLAAKALARAGYAKHLKKKGAAKNVRENSVVVDGEVLWDDPVDPGITREFKKLKGTRKYARGGHVPGVSNPMSAKQALDRFAKGGSVKKAARKLTQRQIDDRAGIDVKGDPYRPPTIPGKKARPAKPGKWPPGNLKPLFPAEKGRIVKGKWVPVED